MMLDQIKCQLENRGFETFLILNKANSKKANIRLSGVIINADPYGLGGIVANDVIGMLNSIDSPEIHIDITSPGGSVIAGMAIRDAIRSHKSKIHVSVVGCAASAATFPVCAADSSDIAPGSKFMIHKAYMGAEGREPDFIRAIELLKQTDADLTAMYAAKSGKSEEEILEAMKAETYFNAEQAVAFGLVDKVKEYEAKAEATVDLKAEDEAKAEDLQNENTDPNDDVLAKARAKHKLNINFKNRK